MAGQRNDGVDSPNIEDMKARAVERGTRGLVEGAAYSLEEIIRRSGGTSDIFYTLGTYYQAMLRFNDAIGMFQRVADTGEFALAARYAIGQCYQSQGHMDRALHSFMWALEAIEPERVEREQVDDIIRVYEGIIDSLEARGDRQEAEHFTNVLIDLLGRRGWEDKVRELRARLGGAETSPATAELVNPAHSAMVLSAMSAAERYRQRGWIRAAIDELNWALTIAPDHLPLHLLLADLYATDNRVADAVAKQVAIAKLYEVRANPVQAIHALRRALELAPTEQGVRNFLIALLTTHGEIDEALENYLHLAEEFYQLAQSERAIEKLNEALRLAPRGSPEKEWSLQIQRRLADIHLQRLDWRRAAAAHEGILNVRPTDLETAGRLVDLYFKLGNEERAVQTVRRVLLHLWRAEAWERALRFVGQQAEVRPHHLPFIQLMGETQVKAGDVDGAARTWELGVKSLVERREMAKAAALLLRIIALHPRQEKRYRAMYSYIKKKL